MCLYTRQILPIRAKKDIICYKILLPVDINGTKFKTPITRTPVDVPGTLIASRCFLRFPLYKNKYCFIACRNKVKDRIYGVDRGFIHAYTSQDKAENCLGFALPIARCTIPKGTLYFISRDKTEICARRMILNHIV